MTISIRIAEKQDLESLHSLWMEIMQHHTGQGPMFDYDANYDVELKKFLSR